MSEAAFGRLLAAAKALHDTYPDLNDFTPLPEDAKWVDRTHRPLPASQSVKAWSVTTSDVLGNFHRAVQDASGHAAWTQSYAEEEVGAHYLRHYGYFELLGPTGHFESDAVRAFVGYWGQGLEYPPHRHEAEEIYLVVSGSALFASDGVPDKMLRCGELYRIASGQIHSITMVDEPLLAYALWRGAGFDKLPTLER